MFIGKKILMTVAAIVTVASSSTQGAGKMYNLVKNGKANVVVVLKEEPNISQIEAAKILADHFKQISGADVKIMGIDKLRSPVIEKNVIIPDPGVTDAKYFIFIGDGDLTYFNLKVDTNAVGYGGFVIKSFPNSIVFAGRDNLDPGDLFTFDNRYTNYSRGTLYAVTWFLEKYLDVKYLWPGELGKVVPKRKNISIPAINYSFTPQLKQRQMRITQLINAGKKGIDWYRIPKIDYLVLKEKAKKTKAESVNWNVWQKFGGSLGVVSGDGYVLEAEQWKSWPKIHPEWFAMQLDGDRSQIINGKVADRPRLCLSNMELIAAIAKSKIAKLKKNPGQRCVSIEPNDGGYMGFCMCDKCKALDVSTARKVSLASWDHKKQHQVTFEYPALSDRMVFFYNEIAKRVTKEFPDVLLLVAQYSVYSAAPIKRQLHPNIVVRFVGESFNWESERKLKMEDWKAWAKMAAKIFYRPNVLYQGYHQGFPLVNFSHKLAEDFKYMAHHSMLGTDFDGNLDMWSTQGLNYYVTAKLNWNPDVDVDEVIDDYCQGFGKGWKWIRKYWDDIEEITNKGALNEKQHMLDPFTPKTIAKLTGYLDNAVKEAGDDKGAHARIAFLRAGLDFTDIQAKTYRMNIKVKNDPNNKLLKTEAQKILDEKWIFVRKLFKKYPMAIDPGLARYRSQRCFYYLGNPSKEVLKKNGVVKFQTIDDGEKLIEADEKGKLVLP